MSRLSKCPRCEERSLESFSAHQYCANCNYGSAADQSELAIPNWAVDVLKAAAAVERKRKSSRQIEKKIAV